MDGRATGMQACKLLQRTWGLGIATRRPELRDLSACSSCWQSECYWESFKSWDYCISHLITCITGAFRLYVPLLCSRTLHLSQPATIAWILQNSCSRSWKFWTWFKFSWTPHNEDSLRILSSKIKDNCSYWKHCKGTMHFLWQFVGACILGPLSSYM
jgi:hypothetical protein